MFKEMKENLNRMRSLKDVENSGYATLDIVDDEEAYGALVIGNCLMGRNK